MTDDSEPDGDGETVQVRCNLDKEWVESELLPAYPAVTSTSDAARTALQEAVENRQTDEKLVQGSIDQRVIDLLEELGGSVSNNQTIKINGASDRDSQAAGAPNVSEEE